MPIDDDALETLLDATGLLCPLPVLRARKILQSMRPGALLRVKATDPVARIDMPHFCSEAGHELMESIDIEGELEFLIRRGPESPSF